MNPDDHAERYGSRQLDLAALKVLSHPIRLQLLEMLSRYGAQTASGLAARIGESSGSTSYHLRQLAKHDLVREVEGKGSARERWWERPPGAINISPPDDGDDRAALAAARIVARQFEQNRAQALDDFIRFGDERLPQEWMQSSVLNSSNLRLDAARLEELSQRVVRFLADLVEEYRGTGGPEARPVQLHFNAFPLVDPSHPDARDRLPAPPQEPPAEGSRP
ncbi:ArsR/SmtB family transcription factor [Zafaria sp. Z1313]|uniref:ArsR/SmtB family transcription factor n=1 Tax=unclassified Zafaria TaxID=2828765 RepID=UPI002E766417|nr:helix-turn-helix domain-containing protein [Zafaria sp. J156]MEE1621559.1 helix-turn-helix domain-containing protein [Zafaria sp. J156]